VHQFSDEHLHVVDLPYRLSSWALDDPDNLRVWVDAQGQLVAWAALQTPFWAIDYTINPHADPHLHAWVLAWADERACKVLNTPHGRPSWYISVFDDQAARISDLERAGFACQSDVGDNAWSKVFMARAREAPLPDATLPGGFNIRPLNGAAEVPACVALHQSVFQSKNMTTGWRQHVLQRPEYRPELDLVAVAPSGAPAAFCVGWFDPHGPSGIPSGQIEPLGVHEDYRRLGLGKAVLVEGLRRLYDMGAQQVFVETDNYRDAAFHLYEWAGFQVRRNVLVYRKDYAGVV
jgi:ribosomal protein S18 acetylase RimI-like enzyme